MDRQELQSKIEDLFKHPVRTDAALELLANIRRGFNAGSLRVAEPPAAEGDTWKLNAWLKQAMILMSTLGEMLRGQEPNGQREWTEFDTLPWSRSTPDAVRMPAGVLLREGAYIGPGTTCLPPAVVQLGSYVGPRSLIDSMALVGAGAQVGAGVQLSCRSTVGGWIFPLDQLPTIVEDGVIMGAGSGVYDGAQVGANAVLMAGVQILPALGLLDLGTGALVPSTPEKVLRVPPQAIVAMGSQAIKGSSAQLNIPVIIGRRHGVTSDTWEMYADLKVATTRS